VSAPAPQRPAPPPPPPPAPKKPAPQQPPASARREPRTRLRPGLRSGLRRAARIAIVLLLVAVAWVAWLAIALEDFSGALEDGDPVALERRIDWVNVQQGLRDDLAAIASSQATSGLNDRAIAALTTRQAVANLLRTVKLDDRGWDMAAPATWPAPSFSWLGIRHAFFSGGPFAFRVDVRPESRTIKRPLILLFKWRGDWQLARVFLPEDSFGRTPRTPQASAQPQTAAQPQASTQPAPAAAPPPGAEQAVLYEETGSDSNGKHLTGSVTWRTEQTPSASGGPPELAVVAEARIPGQPLGMTMTIHRNRDRTLPASHTIDIKFDLPPNMPNGGILNVAAVQLKGDDQNPGQKLAGSVVKVSPDYFLVGLSAIEMDTRLNLQLLKDRPWFDILFVYGNNHRAILSLEKGTTGEKVMAEALAQWASTPAAEGGAAR
jgi:hypothetical protein